MPQPTGYTRTQIVLHWAVFLLVAVQFIFADNISQAFRSFLRGEAVTPSVLVFSHIAVGVTVFLLVLWRMAIKAKRGAPAQPEGNHPMLTLAAHSAHLALYALLILLVASGGMAWFLGFGWAGQVHEVLKALLMILVILHVVASLYHQFVLKDGVLNRMRKPE